MQTKTLKSSGDPTSALRQLTIKCLMKSKALVGIKVGDKITTDHIMPAGARLKYRSNVPEYSKYVFEPIDKDFPRRAMEAKKKGLATVIVAGESYGQGSSREHAAFARCTLVLRQS